MSLYFKVIITAISIKEYGSDEFIDYFSAECPGYDSRQCDGELPLMLELWGMQNILSLPLLPGSLCPGVVAPDIYGSNRTQQRPFGKLNCLKYNCFLHLNCVLMQN